MIEDDLRKSAFRQGYVIGEFSAEISGKNDTGDIPVPAFASLVGIP